MAAAVAAATTGVVRAIEEGDAGKGAARSFRRRMERGDYLELFDEPLRRVLGQAAAVAGVTEEIGAFRFVLARVLMEEEDPARQAMAVARLAHATVRAVEAQRALEGSGRDALLDELTRALRELDNEMA